MITRMSKKVNPSIRFVEVSWKRTSLWWNTTNESIRKNYRAEWGLGNRRIWRKIKTHLGDLASDEVLLKSLNEPTEVKSICCGGCNQREILENINIREDAKLYLYKTNERRTADDLDIYSSICFDCGMITEFSFDPYNFSGNATDGIEYFRSYLVDRSSLKLIFEKMRSMGHLNPILRLISKHPDKLDY